MWLAEPSKGSSCRGVMTRLLTNAPARCSSSTCLLTEPSAGPNCSPTATAGILILSSSQSLLASPAPGPCPDGSPHLQLHPGHFHLPVQASHTQCCKTGSQSPLLHIVISSCLLKCDRLTSTCTYRKYTAW